MSEWRAIPGFPGYEANQVGVVISYRRYPDGLFLKPSVRKGYFRYRLSVGRIVRNVDAHTLVALTFIGPRPIGEEVRHINGDRSDNRLENLEYGTSNQNTEDAVRHGTHNMARKTHCKRGHEFDERNTAMITLRTGSRARRCRACTRDAMRLRRAAVKS